MKNKQNYVDKKVQSFKQEEDVTPKPVEKPSLGLKLNLSKVEGACIVTEEDL